MPIKYKLKLKIEHFKYYIVCNIVFDVQNIYTSKFSIII